MTLSDFHSAFLLLLVDMRHVGGLQEIETLEWPGPFVINFQ